MATAFQPNAFQNNAFQIVVVHPATITDDITFLQQPINAVLDGDQDNIQQTIQFSDVEEPYFREETTFSRCGGGRLSENESTYTTRTDHRGYD